MSIVVLGIGNTLMTDDGAGVFAVQALKARYDFPEGIELIDGGTKGLDLLPFVEGKTRLLFIDAVNLGKSPGTVGELSQEEIPDHFATKISVHQISVPDLIGAGKLLGTLPEEFHLVGIQPESIDTGYGLTSSVQEGFEELLLRVIGKLKEWGVEALYKTSSNSVSNTIKP